MVPIITIKGIDHSNLYAKIISKRRWIRDMIHIARQILPQFIWTKQINWDSSQPFHQLALLWDIWGQRRFQISVHVFVQVHRDRKCLTLNKYGLKKWNEFSIERAKLFQVNILSILIWYQVISRYQNYKNKISSILIQNHATQNK